MPAVYFVGTIDRALGFDEPALFVQFSVRSPSPHWRHRTGSSGGTTWTSSLVKTGRTACHEFSHPINVSFECHDATGWPVIEFTVISVDQYDRRDLAGYGSVRLPVSNGRHRRAVSTWRPVGTAYDQLYAALIGGLPRYTQPSLAMTGAHSKSGHATVSMGIVDIIIHTLVVGDLTRVIRSSQSFGQSTAATFRLNPLSVPAPTFTDVLKRTSGASQWVSNNVLSSADAQAVIAAVKTRQEKRKVATNAASEDPKSSG